MLHTKQCFNHFEPEFKHKRFPPYLYFQNNSMANIARCLLPLLLCLPGESTGSPATGLLLVGGESAELWTPDALADTSNESKILNGSSQDSGKEFASDSCMLPPPPSPMYGHTVDIVNNTIILVHGDSSYQLNSHGWTQGPNTTYNR